MKKKFPFWLYDSFVFSALSLFVLTKKFAVYTDGGFTFLYGFPLPWISDIWAYTGHNSVFVLPFLLNVLIHFIVWSALFGLIVSKSILPQLFSKVVLGLVITFLVFQLVFQLALKEDSYSLWHEGDFTINESYFQLGY